MKPFPTKFFGSQFVVQQAAYLAIVLKRTFIGSTFLTCSYIEPECYIERDFVKRHKEISNECSYVKKILYSKWWKCSRRFNCCQTHINTIRLLFMCWNICWESYNWVSWCSFRFWGAFSHNWLDWIGYRNCISSSRLAGAAKTHGATALVGYCEKNKLSKRCHKQFSRARAILWKVVRIRLLFGVGWLRVCSGDRNL